MAWDRVGSSDDLVIERRSFGFSMTAGARVLIQRRLWRVRRISTGETLGTFRSREAADEFVGRAGRP